MSSSSSRRRIAASAANVMYMNAVYFPNQRIYQGDTPGMLNYSCINHVYYAYAGVSPDGGVFVSLSFLFCLFSASTGLVPCFKHHYAKCRFSTIQLSDEWADTQAPVDGVQGGLGSLMHLKQKHPHLQVVLSIGGGAATEVFPIVAGNTLLRDNFARSALGLIEASGLDGIDSKCTRTADVRYLNDLTRSLPSCLGISI